MSDFLARGVLCRVLGVLLAFLDDFGVCSLLLSFLVLLAGDGPTVDVELDRTRGLRTKGTEQGVN